MSFFARRPVIAVALFVALLLLPGALRADARFDLTGPKIDVRVTRAGQTLDIAEVPNLQPGDKLWLHPDLPPSQSVKYLLICAFLRGTTNPPPDNWFIRIDTWDKKVREEGTFVTVPAEAQQVVLFMAPETGGDFSTLRSAVKGRPGVFVRAQQDLVEAGFEQARIEKYLASIRRVPPSEADDLQKHSDLLARTLALKPNGDCFKRPVDTQFTCLTQSGSQTLLDDGHGQTIVSALSTGQNSDFIQAASYTGLAGAGQYSAYVGAIVDLVRIMGNLHTAQYQYIPAIAFPQGAALNLRLNTPPSFHNPKSVIVVGLPAVQGAIPPPLRPADANQVSCLLRPNVTLPIEGAPLVFSTSYAHELVLHLDTPPGAPAEPDIPLVADAFQGGLVLQHEPEHHRELHDTPKPLKVPSLAQPSAGAPHPASGAGAPHLASGDVGSQDAHPQPEPIMLTGTIRGRWGFDPFDGPTVRLQQLPGSEWHIVTDTSTLIAGHTAQLLLSSTGTACVHTVTARAPESENALKLDFKTQPHAEGAADTPPDLAVTLPLDKARKPGDLHIEIQQYGQPRPDELATRTFAEPAHITAVDLHAGDKSVLLTGTGLTAVTKLMLGDLVFKPATAASEAADTALRLALPDDAPAPPTHADDHLTAKITLNDGRTLSQPVTITAARPSITLLRKSADPSLDTSADTNITLTNPNDLSLNSHLTFTLKSQTPFPRNVQIEVETTDGTLRTVLTLAPSGGLLLQDPHTVVATLDPARSFGPSAFGALHLRAVFPAGNTHPAPNASSEDTPASDWIPLVTLVRLPVFSSLKCPDDPAQPCTLTGTNFFLLQAISADPAFADPTPVPDGYTGSALTVPHPASAGTLFIKLRDDPAPINSATIATPPPPAAPATARVHPSRATERAATHAAAPPPAPAASATPAAAVTPTAAPASPATTTTTDTH